MAAFCSSWSWGDYHDTIWGTRVTDSSELFGQLMLCTQQCGVSWKIVWNKRDHYRAAFHGWDMAAVAAMSAADLDVLVDKEGPWAGKLIQNRAKLNAIVHNARQCLAIDQATAGGLCAFLWQIVAQSPEDEDEASAFTVRMPGLAEPMRISPRAVNASTVKECAQYNAVFGETSDFSDRLAAVLKRTGEFKHAEPAFEKFAFLGSITLQAFLLQNGLLNGHDPRCCKNPRCTLAPALVAEATTTKMSRKRSRMATDDVGL